MQTTPRTLWTDTLLRIAEPVLTAAAEQRLHRDLPLEMTGEMDRTPFALLEAVGRTLVGLAPWLTCPGLTGPEADDRDRLAGLARAAITSITDPASPDAAIFDNHAGDQPLVDAAFLAHALLRAPAVLWEPLAPAQRGRVADGLRAARSIPIEQHMNNWLLFRAMVEAALFRFVGEYEPDPVAFALDHHARWYVGDGVYGDGPAFHADYYNSFVIQPMLLDVLETLEGQRDDWDAMLPGVRARAVRGAAILERLISPEGTYPPIGRSLCYRVGAFQLLGQMALRHELPEGVAPAQVRGALSAVIARQFAMPGTFTEAGFLRPGLAGDQIGLAERYISTASAYLCSAGFLPLGLTPTDPFWTDADADWTAKRAWAGLETPIDKALRDT